jgi:hypothetical protein
VGKTTSFFVGIFSETFVGKIFVEIFSGAFVEIFVQGQKNQLDQVVKLVALG